MMTYYLTLSQVFPRSHPKADQPTWFKEQIIQHTKLHTIRANYDFWKKRFEKIAAGEAVLSIREWIGKPYAKGSTQRELFRLTREDGIGIQRLQFDRDKDGVASLAFFNVDGRFPDKYQLAQNDGLSLNDWREWFRGYDLSKPMAIIHFTPFRY